MAEKNIQIKNLTGDLLFPKTKGAVVFNNSGENLGTVEAGAQVNVLEGIKIDGVELTIKNKIAEYTTPAAAEYSIKKLVAEDANYDAAYAGQYVLTKDNVAVGAVINIAKDQVLKNVELKKAADDAEVEGVLKDEYYFDFTFQNKSEHIYLPAKNLMDIYTAGAGLTLTNGAFAINTGDATVVDTVVTENSTKLVQSGAVYTAIDTVSGSLNTHTTNGDIHVTAAQKEAWTGKQDAITAEAKLSSDLVDDTDKTHKFVTAAEKEAIADVANKANDNAVVHLTGDEEIDGTKTFKVTPVVGTAAAGTNSTAAASTAFVANAIAGCLTYEELA